MGIKHGDKVEWCCPSKAGLTQSRWLQAHFDQFCIWVSIDQMKVGDKVREAFSMHMAS